MYLCLLLDLTSLSECRVLLYKLVHATSFRRLFLIRETPNYPTPNVFHFTASEGGHKAVVRGSCHWHVCVFRGWWICIPALSGWLLIAPHKGGSVLTFGSVGHQTKCRGWCSSWATLQFLQALAGQLLDQDLEGRCETGKKRSQVTPESLLHFFSSNPRKTISGLGSFSYIPVIDFYFSAKDQVFLTTWHTW